MRDVCLVYVPDGADSLISILKEKFGQAARENAEDPYEFRFVQTGNRGSWRVWILTDG